MVAGDILEMPIKKKGIKPVWNKSLSLGCNLADRLLCISEVTSHPTNVNVCPTIEQADARLLTGSAVFAAGYVHMTGRESLDEIMGVCVIAFGFCVHGVWG